MKKPTDKYKKWWLYGAFASLMVAIFGFVLMYFFGYSNTKADSTTTVKDTHTAATYCSWKEWLGK